MVSPLLEGFASKLEARLAPRGILVRGRKVLPNGLQLEFDSGKASCRVNLYHSAKKGFSIVPSGGDSRLLAVVTGSGGSPLPDRPAGSWTGSDEAGKGDYLGPLVACAVYCTAESAKVLTELGAADSKGLSACAIDRVSARLAEFLGDAFECVSLSPPEYNARFADLRMRGMNSNDLLASIHGRAVSALLERGYRPGRMVIDRFCSMEKLQPALPESDAVLELRPGAEDDPAVAAASVLARARYMEELEALGRKYGVKLVPGAGAEADSQASALVERHGPEALSECAKLHFRNTLKVLSGALPDLT